MNRAESRKTEFRVCKPVSSEHRRAVRWFSSLTQLIEREVAREPAPGQSLQHSIQFYSVFAETGDQRYLSLCEDFLKYTLRSTRASPSAGA